MDDRPSSRASTRRQLLLAAGSIMAGGMVGSVLVVRPAGATPASMAAALREVIGEATVQPGKVKLDLPPLIENGNAVPVTVTVESPMTEADHVKTIRIFNEKNPQPNVVALHLGPRSGRATVSTRMRLADSQKVVAIAQLSDGSFWSDTVDVIVTLAACLEDSPQP